MARGFVLLVASILFLIGCGDRSVDRETTSQVKPPADVAQVPANAVKTSSGLAYRVLHQGQSKTKPSPDSMVVVHYSGWTTDGVSFDSSVGRGSPSTFRVSQVIPGWTEALQLMSPGDSYRIWVPEGLAYKGQAGMPAGMLVFDVELLAIKTGAVPSKPTAVKSTSKTESSSGSGTSSPPKPRDQSTVNVTGAADGAPEDVAAVPADATHTASGLATKVLRPGNGTQKPVSKVMVTVHYEAWTTDGNRFESSFVKGEPARLPIDGVIKGLSEGLRLMVVGEKRRMWIPDELAFKHQPRGSKGMVVFDVELIKIEAQKPEPKAPSDVSGPPADAEQTESGLFHKLLKAGTGSEKPQSTSAVRVHYTGWTTDGKVFDSSVVRGKPSVFPLVRVVAGWGEGLQLMVVGEQRRFWIPESLAYRGQPGRPKGMLVFDVELLEIIAIPTTLPRETEQSEESSMKKGQMGDFNPLAPPPGFTECHDLHCHHKNGRTFSYASVMKKMGTDKVVEGQWGDPQTPPSNVAAPPSSASKTDSGISHILLFTHKFTDSRRPEIDSIVRFHFSGWTRSGQSFLSSLLAGREVELPLVTIPSPGLVEAIQSLSVGEKRRFWIPGTLMGREQGMQVPEGDLTFDIELIDFK